MRPQSRALRAKLLNVAQKSITERSLWLHQLNPFDAINASLTSSSENAVVATVGQRLRQIIFLTAHGDAEIRDLVMNAGALGYLTKPVHRGLLLSANRIRHQEHDAHVSPKRTLLPVPHLEKEKDHDKFRL
jgi:DNA-binding NarL/FixJ family response regulator